MRRLLCAVLLLSVSARAFGQEGESPLRQPRPVETGAAVARLLKSKESRERAWGAHLVWRHDLREHVPALVELLGDASLGTGGEDEFVRRAALDSLIQLGEKVPAETLTPLYQSFPDEVVILLARSAEENQAALASLFDDQMPAGRWVAVANLLAESRSRELAAPLLRGMRIEADVWLLNEGQDISTGGGGGSGGCGSGSDAAPTDFPPVGFYALTEGADRGAVVVAPGRNTVYYLRSTSPNPCAGYGRHYDTSWRDAYRREYLADLLRLDPDGWDFKVFHSLTINSDDARKCRRALVALRRKIVDSHAALLARLVEENLLDASDAGALEPDVTFNLHDYRAKKTYPAPQTLKGVKLSVIE